jgi:O-acetyl-ADP-ribose deacetylase (regulator of RNase III)
MKTAISLLQGDITTIKADAIVNAANSSLMGGGGVDGAIHRAGGPQILEACKKIVARQGACKTGEAVITTGGRLPAKFVIHTVGPVYNGGQHDEKKLLSNCYSNSLKLAVENGLKKIDFPNISTGVYRFPKKEAANIAVETVTAFAKNHLELEEIIFVCFDDENFAIYKQLIK